MVKVHLLTTALSEKTRGTKISFIETTMHWVVLEVFHFSLGAVGCFFFPLTVQQVYVDQSNHWVNQNVRLLGFSYVLAAITATTQYFGNTSLVLNAILAIVGLTYHFILEFKHLPNYDSGPLLDVRKLFKNEIVQLDTIRFIISCIPFYSLLCANSLGHNDAAIAYTWFSFYVTTFYNDFTYNKSFGEQRIMDMVFRVLCCVFWGYQALS